MATIVVEVMLKPEILDPQGQAVAAALPRLGFTFAQSVRQGKRFEITVDGDPTPEQLADVERAAQTLLSNPVIESYLVKVEAKCVLEWSPFPVHSMTPQHYAPSESRVEPPSHSFTPAMTSKKLKR